VDTLNEEIDAWCARQPDIACDLAIHGDLSALDEDTSITLYRVVQECLTNVAKHARAHMVGITVDTGQCDVMGSQASTAMACIRLVIEDDGVGIAADTRATGLGLIGMRERVESLEGRFKVESVAGSGTTVMVVLPLTSADSDA
jgi:two-component system sensor histidine kinase UhpB